MPGPKIMLVEDEKEMGMIVSSTLRSASYRVTWAKDGIQALSLAKTVAGTNIQSLPTAIYLTLKQWLHKITKFVIACDHDKRTPWTLRLGQVLRA